MILLGVFALWILCYWVIIRGEWNRSSLCWECGERMKYQADLCPRCRDGFHSPVPGRSVT